MKRTALVLTGALAGAALLAGCGSTPTAGADLAAPDLVASDTSADPSADTSAAPTGAPSAAPTEAGRRSAPASATRRTATSGRPANALSWGEPRFTDEDLDHGVRAAWAERHRVSPAAVRGDQLFVGLADRGGLLVGAYQLWAPGVRAHVVVAQGERGSEAVLVRDTPARPDLVAVEGVVSRQASYVVVANAPGTTRVQYRAAQSATWRTIEQDSLDLVVDRPAGTGAGEALRITRHGRTTVVPVHGGSTAPAAGGTAKPANALSWPARGDARRGPSVDVVARAYAREMRAPSARVSALFSGDTDGGVRFLVGQAWVPGQPARTVGYVLRPGREAELLIQPVTPRGARLVALLVTDQPGTTTDLLVVVPEPGNDAVAYRTSSSATWRTSTTPSYLDGVALVDRATGARGDQLRLTGRSTLVVDVARALCDGPECG